MTAITRKAGRDALVIAGGRAALFALLCLLALLTNRPGKESGIGLLIWVCHFLELWLMGRLLPFVPIKSPFYAVCWGFFVFADTFIVVFVFSLAARALANRLLGNRK